MGCYVKMTGVTLEKIHDPDKHVFRTRNEVLVILIKDIGKDLKISIFSIVTWIIYMDVLLGNIYLLVILNGSRT